MKKSKGDMKLQKVVLTISPKEVTIVDLTTKVSCFERNSSEIFTEHFYL
jgi:hypothetical protein